VGSLHLSTHQEDIEDNPFWAFPPPIMNQSHRA
jgi:hypothetical protein